MPYNTYTPTVIANSGCQHKFYPLALLAGTPNVFPLTQEFHISNLTSHFQAVLQYAPNLAQQANRSSWTEICSFVKARTALRKIRNSEFVGVELAIETNQDDGTHKRGVMYKRRQIAADDPKFKDFVSAQGTILQPPSVYNQIADGQWSDVYRFDIPGLEGTEYDHLEFKIGFRVPAANPIDVDLVIDFGNTRTVALLLDRVDKINDFPQHCRPVLLKLSPEADQTPEADSGVSSGIVNSWFVLRQTIFDSGNREPELLERFLSGDRIPVDGLIGKLLGKNRFCITCEENRIPQMFVHTSPVVIGDRAEELLNDAGVAALINHGAQMEQSSPKRYYWDNQPTTHDWNMIVSDRQNDSLPALKLPLLRAEILRYISESGEYIDPESVSRAGLPVPDPAQPRYPRACTFVWMLVNILERAWKQCNSNNVGIHMFLYRKLKNVIVTYPSGWSRDQVEAYRERCQEAIEIFQKTNFPKSDQEVKLIMNLDEAVASQIPYIFSEIHEFSDNADGWLQIAGKLRANVPSVRIMNFDIGGGTTDISIIEYTNAAGAAMGVDILPTLLYKDGITFGGDDILKKIILEIVFHSISEQVANPDVTADSLHHQIHQIFTHNPKDAQAAVKRVRILRLCLIPFAIRILSDLSSGRASGNNMILTLPDAGITMPQWEELLSFFEQYNVRGVPGFDTQFQYSPAAVNRLIRAEFTRLLNNTAALAIQNDVDIFFMSGKTSEQPCLMQLAQEIIPLPKNRIVAAKNYRVGTWYPFVSSRETIEDAKSVTAVGAALHAMLCKGLVPNWQIQNPVSKLTVMTEWGILDILRKPTGKPFFSSSAPDGSRCAIQITANTMIGKRMTPDAEAEPVYRFKRKDGNFSSGFLNVEFQKKREQIFSRNTNGEECVTDIREYLELTSVSDRGKIVTSEYELIICQDESDGQFWQDSGVLF